MITFGGKKGLILLDPLCAVDQARLHTRHAAGSLRRIIVIADGRQNKVAFHALPRESFKRR